MTVERGGCHLSESLVPMALRRESASRPRSPSVEATKGAKWHLLEACPEIVFLLSGFVGFEHCVGVFGVVGLGIEVNNGDINEAVSGS